MTSSAGLLTPPAKAAGPSPLEPHTTRTRTDAAEPIPLRVTLCFSFVLVGVVALLVSAQVAMPRLAPFIVAAFGGICLVLFIVCMRYIIAASANKAALHDVSVAKNESSARLVDPPAKAAGPSLLEPHTTSTRTDATEPMPWGVILCFTFLPVGVVALCVRVAVAIPPPPDLPTWGGPLTVGAWGGICLVFFIVWMRRCPPRNANKAALHDVSVVKNESSARLLTPPATAADPSPLKPHTTRTRTDAAEPIPLGAILCCAFIIVGVFAFLVSAQVAMPRFAPFILGAFGGICVVMFIVCVHCDNAPNADKAALHDVSVVKNESSARLLDPPAKAAGPSPLDPHTTRTLTDATEPMPWGVTLCFVFVLVGLDALLVWGVAAIAPALTTIGRSAPFIVGAFGGIFVVVLLVCARCGPAANANNAALHGVSVAKNEQSADADTDVNTDADADADADAELVFSVNGVEQRISRPDPSLLLAHYLRDTLGLTGTKVGCGEGGCGACTCVAVGADGVPHAINACLRLLCACDGLAITTVEGLGSQARGFSPIQLAIADGQGSQCGFCTPGWVTAMAALLARSHLDHKAGPDSKTIEEWLDGNLCRCTGYRPILQAFKQAFATDAQSACCSVTTTPATDPAAAPTCGCPPEKQPPAADALATAADIEDVSLADCHDVRTRRPCGRECDAAVAAAKAAAAKAAEAVAAVPASVRARADMRVRLKYADATTKLEYHRPTSLAELRSLLKATPTATIVAANTGMGVAKYYTADGPAGGAGPTAAAGQPPQRNACTVDVSGVTELRAPPTFDAKACTLTVGAAVTIEDLIIACDATAASTPAASAVARALSRHLRRVATTQVRAVGSWAGNIALAAKAPALPSDVLTLFAAARATLRVASRDGSGGGGGIQEVSVTEFVAAAREHESAPLALIVSATLHLSGTHAYADKTSQRHANSHAIVNACLVAELDPHTGTVSSCTAAVGGVLASGVFVAATAAAGLVGHKLTEEAAMRAFVTAAVAEAKASPLSHDEQNSQEYRLGLLASFAYKFFLTAQTELPPGLSSAVADSLAAAADRPVSHGVQRVGVGNPKLSPVGDEGLPKLTSRLQASGEAQYTSDHPRMARELCGAFINTAVAHGVLEAIDLTRVRAAPGVVDVVLATDFKTPAINDDPKGSTTPHYLLPVGASIPCVGAHVGLVLADTLAHARFGAKLAELRVTPAAELAAEPTRGTRDMRLAAIDAMRTSGLAKRMGVRAQQLEEATASAAAATASASVPASASASATAPTPTPTVPGMGEDDEFDAQGWGFVEGRPATEWAATAEAEGRVVLSGRFHFSGQKHFFLETHTAYASPCEDGKMVVVSANQAPASTQAAVAQVLGVPLHKVDVRVRRIGGAYGGKIEHHMPTAVVAALAAHKLGVPVRLHHERADDMASTGGRAPLSATWTAAADPQTGVVSSCALKLEFDSGCQDGAYGDLAMAVLWSDNCYHHLDFSCAGNIVRTPRPGNTACRAPGVLQSVPLHEAVMEAVAHTLKLPADAVREANLYAAGQRTPSVCGGQLIGVDGFDWTVPRLWRQAKTAWEVDRRRAAAKDFNAKSRWRKRGVSLLPIKYGISFSDYQLAAAVRIFADDGSVHVVHGGVEMGQGIHTKVAQAVAYSLGCPLAAVTVGDTSSLDAPNSGITGGSGTSESSVRAALDATAKLVTALAPYRQGSWAQTVAAAAKAGVGLHAAGWERVPEDKAKPFAYATQGVGCVEVELDALTGEVRIIRADVLMDQGTPLNPWIDMGQVEGGFVMALGYFLTEEVLWTKDGTQLNLGTWQYKPPAVHDIPIELNVEFLAKAPNQCHLNVFGSKASAEPPMALGAAALFAARDAIMAVRADAGVDEPLELEAPLTVERIQRACLVDPAHFTLR